MRPCMAATLARRKYTRAVPCGVDPVHTGPRDTIDLDVAVLVDGHADRLTPEVGGVRHSADGHEAMSPRQRGPVLERDHHAVLCALARLRHGTAATAPSHGSAAPPRAPRPRRDPVWDPLPRRHQHDITSQRRVGTGEFCARDAGADDDQPLGQFREVVQLLPGEGCARRPEPRSAAPEGGSVASRITSP